MFTSTSRSIASYLAVFASLYSGSAFALTGGVGSTQNSVADSAEKPTAWRFIQDNFGMNYNSFFSGPGVGQPLNQTPGLTGAPSDTGLNFFNLVSVKWKATKNIGIDLQFRNQVVVTNGTEYRHQGQRLGISGTLLKGETWSFAGALNTDIPIPAIMGQIASQRTLLFNPGLFSFFSWNPKGSKWSLFSVVAPRLWVYRDINATAVQDDLNGGLVQKPEYTIYLNPSINYAFNEKLGARLGTTLEYTKFVGFNEIRRNYMPMEFGVTYDVSDALSIYPYIFASTPLDNDLRQAQGFASNDWTKTISFNLWLSGKLF